VELDVTVGNIVKKLEQLDLLRDTVIIFVSDNGGVRLPIDQRGGHETSGDLRGDKGTIYEGGHRVPLIVIWGDRAFGTSPLAPGTTIDALVGIQDLYATLAALTGVPLSIEQARDSFNLLPLLMGQASSVRDHMVQEADRPEDNAPNGGISGRHFAYRRGPWKLVFDSSRDPLELYNLNADPGETTNLRSQQAQSERVADMKAGLEDALASERTAPAGAPPDPGFTLSPGDISFGAQGLNIASALRAVSMENAGGAAVAIDSIDLGGASPGQFLLNHNCPDSLQAGASCTLNVRFRPTSVGDKTASLRVSTVGDTRRRVVELSGIGVKTQRSVTPSLLDFGNQGSGTTSAPESVNVRNTGTVALPIRTISIGGPNRGQYVQSDNCPAVLPVGNNCRIEVVFRPTSPGLKTARLLVSFDGGAATRSIDLTGTGT
jgi:hypothetical protein